MNRPNILCCSGLDPSGGAGLQADIEAIAASGGHALIALTATTVQDSRNAYAVNPVNEKEFARVLDVLADDMNIAAIKTGVLGSPAQVHRLAEFQRLHDKPLVTDPVLKAGGGAQLAADPVAAAIVTELLPVSTVVTPNTAEARLLCGRPEETDISALGQQLSALGSWVLITGADEAANNGGNSVSNHLFHAGERVETYSWPRLPHSYHGSGCTLAAAIAAEIGKGAQPRIAVETAQRYTYQCLERGFRPGSGQYIPARLVR